MIRSFEGSPAYRMIATRFGAATVAGLLAVALGAPGCGSSPSVAQPPVKNLPLVATNVAPMDTLGLARSRPLPPPEAAGLRLIETFPLGVAEPSDLAIDESGTVLWTVGGSPDRVYQLDLRGKIVKTLSYVGSDLEGIAYDRSDRTLWVAEENRREIIHLDLDGGVLSRHQLDLSGEKNSGIEGLCLDDKGHMFALNEKRPGLLLELDAGHSISARRDVRFAKDYSGIAFDPKSGDFWIVSDQSQELYLWSRQTGVALRHPLPFPKAEGVAVNDAGDRIYIVSDSENKLYVYELRR